MDRKEYAVGLYFSTDEKRVVLIRKKRPSWQAGWLNGPGGHVEPNEHPDVTVSREFEEETGARVEGWTRFLTLNTTTTDSTIHFYYACGDQPVRSTTDEEVAWWPTKWPTNPEELMIPNLRWIIPMALGFVRKASSILPGLNRYVVNER